MQKLNFQDAKCCSKVVVGGENWDAANEEAVKAAQQENTFLVHPFDQVILPIIIIIMPIIIIIIVSNTVLVYPFDMTNLQTRREKIQNLKKTFNVHILLKPSWSTSPFDQETRKEGN